MELIVKPLNWQGPFSPCEECRYDHVKAESPLGKVTIEWKGWKERDSYDLYVDGWHKDSYYTLDEAKEGASKYFLDLVRELIDIPEGVTLK